MINKVVLIGRMTREVELRYTQSQKAVGNFTLAVNRAYKNQNGERETDFIQCTIWNNQAEALAKWTEKGTLVGICGRIQTRHYDKENGERVYITEVVADEFELLESKNKQAPATGGGDGKPAQDEMTTPRMSQSAIDIATGDLPF